MENFLIGICIFAGVFFIAACVLGGIAFKQAQKINDLEKSSSSRSEKRY